MWNFNSENNKWVLPDEKLAYDDYQYLLQELSLVRFYSKALSGATYLPVNDLNNIYDILGSYTPKNWYIGIDGSQYSNTLIPTINATPINATSSYDYYRKYLKEYGQSLKTLFTPRRLITDSISNFIEVDVATTIELTNIGTELNNFRIDDVVLLEGHKVLVKDQKTRIVLSNTINPDDYFKGNYVIIRNLGSTIEYEYLNEQNGIYNVENNILVKSTELNQYEDCIRFSVRVKMGSNNSTKQFHLSRLKNGYYPSFISLEPIEFKENKNWMLRNKVNYNNLFEINHYDLLKHGTQSYNLSGITYSIPERTITVGEFGTIICNQSGVSNIISNKYKVNLRSISQTSKYYWVCGDSGVLLKIRKHDFEIEKISLIIDNLYSINFRSVSFFSDLRGVVVGDLNTIYLTIDSGNTWKRLRISDFDTFYFTKVIFNSASSFIIGGKNGVFVEFKESVSGWTAYRRRISKFIDDDDEYLLVDNINDLFHTSINSWNPTFGYLTQSVSPDKELVFITTNDSKIIVYDLNKSNGVFDFLYLDLNDDYGDIMNIGRRESTNDFYFTGMKMSTSESGVFSFDISNFQSIGVGNSYSNTIVYTASTPQYQTQYYPNELIDYNGDELLMCGNTSLLKIATYSLGLNFVNLDDGFDSRLKSKLLYLDYDAASKLNFFTDFGDYRLPNELVFDSASFSSGSLHFEPIVYYPEFPDYMTQSETNWWTYYSDSKKTFEFYNQTLPLDESNSVLISTTFSYSPTQSEVSITKITNTASVVKYLAPLITEHSSQSYGYYSRFNAMGLTAISDPLTNDELYLYDYLMVFKCDLDYPVNIGDLMNFKNQWVEGNFVVNKIVNFASYKFVYMFTEFNDNIITNIIKSGSSTIKNLNVYLTIDEFESRFNQHPLSYAYLINSTYQSTTRYLNIIPQFNNITSYYNLATNVYLNTDKFTMSYTEGFLDFKYTPTYNILSYLEGLNDPGYPNPKFTADKEYLAMPDYRGIPMSGDGIGIATASVAYISYNGLTYSNYSNPIQETSNTIKFGKDLILEWESIFINTFVDINLWETPTYDPNNPTSTTERLLVMKKYYDSTNDLYVIQFHKNINYNLGNFLYWVDIISRRKLIQISNDLQELNNIQKAKLQKKYPYRNYYKGYPGYSGSEFYNYENDLNFKIPTDSYAKILLSDSDTVQSITSIIYIDDKNEMAMNITNIEEQVSVPILNTANFSGNLFIFCSDKHGLKTNDSVVLEFNGGTGSSQYVNQDYFGYHPVVVVNEYNFYINQPYGNVPLVGNDSGYVKYIKGDPFLEFVPVDLMEVGVSGNPKQSIELNVDNQFLTKKTYSLKNIDFNKYRFRLVDGLNLLTIYSAYPWLMEAEISGAIIGQIGNELTWYSGTWENGRWFGGRWISGQWISGDWYSGTWDSKIITDKLLNVEFDNTKSSQTASTWFGGRWFGGTWNQGTWIDGRWYDGTWNSGNWYRGIWNDGVWNTGRFGGGVWVLGTWNDGVFNSDNEPSFWVDGKWYGGDFENGIWYNGVFDESNGKYSRFGVNSYNSRTSIWHSGNWMKGQFHSRLNLDDSGSEDVSDVHKYSIWYTGNWFDGDFYGGVAYNMNWKTGNWHGGILEDIQLIGFGSDGPGAYYLMLNGIFKFNIGDEFRIIDNNSGVSYSTTFGSNSSPKLYKVLSKEEDLVNKWTKVYVATNITSSVAAPVDLNLRIVSNFANCNWKSGIWTNGIYQKGLWEGGIWYNGVFEAIWM